MVHIHHSQPLKTKFGNNHFLGSATLGPKQYRKGVKKGTTVLKIIRQFVKMLMLCKNDVEQLSAICIPNHFDINKDNLEIVLFP